MKEFNSEKIIKELAIKHNISFDKAIKMSEFCIEILKEMAKERNNKNERINQTN